MDPIRRAVDDCVANRATFTAWNVTQLLRAAGAPQPHAHVRQRVHGLYASGALGPDYRRTLAPMPDGVRAWIYHPRDAVPEC